jgi:hypothetical protein
MEELVRQLSRLLVEVILPQLQAVQVHQNEQIAAETRLQRSIDELRLGLEGQFASLTAQLTACRAELAATQAVLQAAQAQKAVPPQGRAPLVH